MKYLSVLMIALALITGCAGSNLSDIMSDKAKGKGDVRIFPVSSEKAWNISDLILHDWMGSNDIEKHKDQGYLLAKTDSGGLIGVWIEAVDEKNSRVTAISRRKSSFQVTTPLNSYDFCVRFEQAVTIIKSGGLPPKTIPPWPAPGK